MNKVLSNQSVSLLFIYLFIEIIYYKCYIFCEQKSLLNGLSLKSLPVFNRFVDRSVQTSCVNNKQVSARYTRCKTRNKSFPMTYEMTNPPYYIAVRKGWNSWNTSSLVGIERTQTSRVTIDDFFIRKFIFGTFHRLFLSEVIIKRRANLIIISGICHQMIPATKYYFLIGYTEQILSYILKCVVKMDFQITADPKALVVKYI